MQTDISLSMNNPATLMVFYIRIAELFIHHNIQSITAYSMLPTDHIKVVVASSLLLNCSSVQKELLEITRAGEDMNLR